jgi:TolA-binding protein
MSERLTRKEIKKDEFVEAVESSVSWVEQHGRTLILAGIAVVVLVAAGFGTYFWLQARSVEASEALDAALKVYRAPVGPDATADDDGPTFADEAARRARAKELFQAVRADHGSSDAADVAGVYLGQIAADEGDTGSARELWTDYVDSHGDDVLAGQVRVNLLHLDRQEGRAEEVAAKLEGMLTEAPEERTLPADVVLWELATTYEALGRDDEAQSTYRRLSEEYPTSGFAAQARSKLPAESGGAGAQVMPSLG